EERIAPAKPALERRLVQHTPRAMIRAHLLRWRPRPPCHVTRETSGPAQFLLRGPDMAPHSPKRRTPRVTCHRAPPRSWTLLIALAGFLRQAPGLDRPPRGRGS